MYSDTCSIRSYFILFFPPAVKDEYPTLLHFAARFGLEKLCWVLLECPGGELACDIRNVCELTPSEMAENAGHTKLANALCGYMVTYFSSTFHLTLFNSHPFLFR